MIYWRTNVGMNDVIITNTLFFVINKPNRFYVALGLYSDRSWNTSTLVTY